MIFLFLAYLDEKSAESICSQQHVYTLNRKNEKVGEKLTYKEHIHLFSKMLKQEK